MNTLGFELKRACRLAMLASDSGDVGRSNFDGGVCVGTIATALNIFKYFSADALRICPPLSVTPQMGIVVFLNYLDNATPDTDKEPSLILLSKAFKEKWQCPQ